MKIGKFDIIGGAFGNAEAGYQGHVMTTWNEGNETLQQPHYFDKFFPTEEGAMQHAYEQARLHIESGDW